MRSLYFLIILVIKVIAQKEITFFLLLLSSFATKRSILIKIYLTFLIELIVKLLV